MSDFEQFLDRVGLEGDAYRQEYLKAKQMKYRPLLDLMLRFNGRICNSFYDIFARKFMALEISLTAPQRWGKWEFNDPIKEIRVLGNGMGSVKVFEGDIEPSKWIFDDPGFKKAMIRFIPLQTAGGEPRGLHTPEKFFSLPTTGTVPYLVRIVAYTHTGRYRIDVNMVNNNVIEDFRQGKIPPKIHAKRKLEEYIWFDRVYATVLTKRFHRMVFEAIFESSGIDIETLALIFNTRENIIKNNIAVLMKHDLVFEDEGLYKAKVLKPSR